MGKAIRIKNANLPERKKFLGLVDEIFIFGVLDHE